MNDLYISLDNVCSPMNEKIRVERAWEHFILDKNSAPKVRHLTHQSWKRSLRHGVHPLEGKAPLILSEEKIQEYQSSNPIFSTIEPLLINLNNTVKDSGYLLVFCNQNGEIVYLDGVSSLRQKAENINFIAGTSWAEHHAGTNGMGAALATGHPMQVFAGEHFCQPVHNWVCSAAPIKDPATNKVLGAINLTGIWDTVHPHSLTTVISVAQLVEEKLLNRLKFEQFLLMEHYIEISEKKSNKHFAIIDRGCKVIRASPLFYENGWIDKSNYFNELNKEILWKEAKYSWQIEKRDGIWTFEVIPYFYQEYQIGAILYAIPPVIPSNNTVNSTKHSFSSMIGLSDKFLSFITEARSVASIDLPVLIEGESGTGKELLAQSIHSSSLRSSGAFVAVNCGAIPKELAASELFGYEEGTFTGGQKGGKSGKFQLAEGGTIFLDEIGEMPLDLQTMLLRVLEEGEVVRLGGKQPIKLNVRVIAATNCDLKKACEEGKFRKDLYYRLNILSLKVPPLRERSGDIPLIFEHLLKKICIDLRRPPLLINDQALLALKRYDWPGNVRELRNLAYQMAVKVKGNVITRVDLPKELAEEQTFNYTGNPINLSHSSHQSFVSKKKVQSLKEQELDTILAVLDELNGNVTETAKRLGIHRSTIYKKLKRRDPTSSSLK